MRNKDDRENNTNYKLEARRRDRAGERSSGRNTKLGCTTVSGQTYYKMNEQTNK